MPTLFVHFFEGRSLDEKRTLVKNLTSAVVESFGVKPEAVTIHLMEKPKENLAKGGVLKVDEK